MRRTSHPVSVGGVVIGGGAQGSHAAPIAIQSMTNTDTADVAATVSQVIELVEAGSELVRVTVNNEAAAAAVPLIKKELVQRGVNVPLIGDFHYNGHLLLAKFPECAQALDKYRINPGNVGSGDRHDANFEAIIKTAIKNDKPVRIGVNWGSLDAELFTSLMNENGKRETPLSDDEVTVEAMVQSALNSAALAEKLGMPKNKIIVGVKTSDVMSVVDATRKLASRCEYPIHLGLTEAGTGMKGAIASSAAMSMLLMEGIGDTIRISLTPEPGGSRTQEVEACKLLLQSLKLRFFQPFVTSCPGCGRTENARYQDLAQKVNEYMKKRLPEWKKVRPNVSELHVAIMGCVVNGPGESRRADIAISLPGRSEEPIAMVFTKGKLLTTLRGGDITAEFLKILETFVTS